MHGKSGRRGGRVSARVGRRGFARRLSGLLTVGS